MEKRTLLTLLMMMILSSAVWTQEVSVVLKNRNVVVGRILEEHPDHILVASEIGQVLVKRNTIETIRYEPFIRFEDSGSGNGNTGKGTGDLPGARTVLNDRVVVHLRNGSVVSGLLLAKSLAMVMVQTDDGRLTIPKNDIKTVEYISSEYAERGEPVVVRLNSGTRLQGSIYYEDDKSLTMDTDNGRLTVEKNNLRSIEYSVQVAEREFAPRPIELPGVGRTVLPRLDDFELGYSSRFGSNFSPGFLAGYTARFLLAAFDGFYISGTGHISLGLFSLDDAAFSAGSTPAAATVKGGAFVTTMGVGPSLNLYPQTSAFYEFYITPSLEGHIIYKKLERSFPSFPALNSKVQETKFFFGVGNKVGLDFLVDDWRLGFSYNNHFIFGDEDYNRFSIHFVKKVF